MIRSCCSTGRPISNFIASRRPRRQRPRFHSDGKSIADGKEFKEIVKPSKPKLNEQGLYFFSLINFAPKYNNPLPFYFQTGLVYKGLIPTRDQDQLGVAFAYGNYSYYKQLADERRGRATQVYEAVLGVRLSHPGQQVVLRPAGASIHHSAKRHRTRRECHRSRVPVGRHLLTLRRRIVSEAAVGKRPASAHWIGGRWFSTAGLIKAERWNYNLRQPRREALRSTGDIRHFPVIIPLQLAAIQCLFAGHQKGGSPWTISSTAKSLIASSPDAKMCTI